MGANQILKEGEQNFLNKLCYLTKFLKMLQKLNSSSLNKLFNIFSFYLTNLFRWIKFSGKSSNSWKKKNSLGVKEDWLKSVSSTSKSILFECKQILFDLHQLIVFFLLLRISIHTKIKDSTK